MLVTPPHRSPCLHTWEGPCWGPLHLSGHLLRSCLLLIHQLLRLVLVLVLAKEQYKPQADLLYSLKVPCSTLKQQQPRSLRHNQRCPSCQISRCSSRVSRPLLQSWTCSLQEQTLVRQL
jgi:hypothetical protein